MTKFKVGDTVQVKSLEWYNENKDKDGNIVFSDKSKFCKSMSQFCGRFITINKIETPLLGSTWYSGLGAFCSFAYWMLEDKPVATTASLSPPFNHPSDPSLTSHETTYLKKEESRTSALPFDATKVMTPIPSKEFYNTFKPINAEQFNITLIPQHYYKLNFLST